MIAVASTHPLAGRPEVSIEELPDWNVVRMAEDINAVIVDAIVPTTTPSGKPLVLQGNARSPLEIVRLVASGQAAHLTIPRFRAYTDGQDIVFVPVPDLPPVDQVLLSREDDGNPWVGRFLAFASRYRARPRPRRRSTGTS